MATRNKKSAEVQTVDTFDIGKITVDKALQPRVSLSTDAISDYHDVIFEGGELPPMDVFQVGDDYLLVDGFHRISAYRKLGIIEVPVNVHTGTREDAIRFAIGANRAHGLRRSNPDKRRAVEMAFGLMAENKANWTDTYIGEMAGVSSMFVGNVRKELFPETKEATERTTASGKTISVVGRGRKTPTLRDPEPTPEPGKSEKTTSGSKSGPLGVMVDRLIHRTDDIQKALTELNSLFPNTYNLGEALGSNANLAVTFGKIRKRVAAVSAELNSIPLPFEVTEDAPNVATPAASEEPKPEAEAKPKRERKPKAGKSPAPVLDESLEAALSE